MSDEVLIRGAITLEMVHNALNLVTYEHPDLVEAPEPVCNWTKVCGEQHCKFPRYSRDGAPHGLVASILSQLGYPLGVLKELDREYEVGEVLHPGVKIARSRNAALARIDSKGVALLGFLQDRQKSGRSWSQLSVAAFTPRWSVMGWDKRRRPWLY